MRLAGELQRRGCLAVYFRYAEIQELKRIDHGGHLGEWLARRRWGHLDVAQNESRIADPMRVARANANVGSDLWWGVDMVFNGMVPMWLSR